MPESDIRLTMLAHGGGCGCKIAPALLREILAGTPTLPAPAALLVGRDLADDAAVYRLNDEQALIATTDFFMPVVDDPYDFGRISAANAISDVYAMGGTPIMALAIVGMPIERLPAETIARVLAGGEAICREAGIPVAGGHSIDAVEPIYGLVALGLVHPDRVKRNTGACPGDSLVLGKPIGIGVLSAALKQQRLATPDYARLIGITTALNRAGTELGTFDDVHAMTDVTGFGLAGHALEVARGSNATVVIDWNRVPTIDGVLELVNAGVATGASGRNWASYGADVHVPAGFAAADRMLLTDPQTSGGLLVACAPDSTDAVIDCLRRGGLADAAVIGHIERGAPCVRVV